MAVRRTLTLTETARHDLCAARDHDPYPYIRERAAALLKIAEGQSPHAVARHGLLKPRDPDTVYEWLTWYQKYGIRSLAWFRHGGAHRVSPDRTEELTTVVQQAPGEAARQALAPTLVVQPARGEAAGQALGPTTTDPPPSRWTPRGMQASVPGLKDYSLSGVWRVLDRAGIRVRMSQVAHYSPDPAYAEEGASLEACSRQAAQAPARIVVVVLDEMGYHRWPEPALTWWPGAPAPAPEAERVDANNQQWRLSGALNALTGQVHYLDNDIVGREQISRLYRQIDRLYPEAERIYVVQDNWSVHQHPDVLTTLTGLPRLTPVWLPTYAPWLNPIEKLWRWLRQRVLKGHRLAGEWEALQQRVRACLDQFRGGSQALLRYVGLLGNGRLARALKEGATLAHAQTAP